MAYSFTLERAYLSKEFSRPAPSQVRVVGTLLASAFQRPQRDSPFRDLLERLSTLH